MTMIKPDVFTVPFAHGGDYDTFPLTSSGTSPNQILGYPPIFATAYSAGGLPIDIGQTNGVFNAYSTQSVWLQGGGTFTFEPSWVTANGGYDLGTVLSYTRQFGSLTINKTGFCASTLNGNTTNFNINPGSIGSEWIDISNNYSVNPTQIAGNNPYSFIATAVLDAYTISSLFSTNGTNNNFSNIEQSYSDGGDGNFKPTLHMISKDPSGYSGSLDIGPAQIDEGYNGYIASMNSMLPNADFSRVLCSNDTSNHPNVQIFLGVSSIVNTGINVAQDVRPVLLGNLTSLAIGNAALVTFQDIQSGTTGVISSLGSLTVTLPFSMSTGNYSICLTPKTATASTVTGTYSATPINTTSFSIGNDLSVNMSFNWIAVWNGF